MALSMNNLLSNCVILDFLKLGDIQKVASLSKSIYELVAAYCNSKLDDDFKKRFELFLNKYNYLEDVKRDENKLKSKLIVDPIGLYLIGTKYLSSPRVDMVDLDWFAHLDNPEYIIKEYDTTIKKNVVHLLDVCWLECRHTLNNVGPGVYQMVLRMKLYDEFHWPGSVHPTIYTLKWEGDQGEQSLSRSVKPRDWDELKKTIDEYKKYTGIDLSFLPKSCVTATINVKWNDGAGSHTYEADLNDTEWVNTKNLLESKSDRAMVAIKECLPGFTIENMKDGWFDLILTEPIVLQKQSNVFFTMADVVNPNWKHHMGWDYLELKCISQ